ncbi:hypothetical protein MASR2M48_04240 [Spirochaetota bacterium]
MEQIESVWMVSSILQPLMGWLPIRSGKRQLVAGIAYAVYARRAGDGEPPGRETANRLLTFCMRRPDPYRRNAA